MLYVTLQRDVNPETLDRELQARGIRQWIYLGEDSAWRVPVESFISSVAGRLSIADLLDKISWKLRQPYIDWVGQLSLLNNSLEWWASELAAKNPYSRLYIRLCLLGVGREIIRRGFDRPTLTVCSSPALYEEIVHFARESGVRVQPLVGSSVQSWVLTVSKMGWRYVWGTYRRLRLLTARILGREKETFTNDPSYRRRLLLQKGVAINGVFAGNDTVLLFTWVDHRNFTDEGRYRDPHLGPLAEMLRQEGYRVAYVPRVLPNLPFGEIVDRLRKTGEQLFFPELYISDEERRFCHRRAREFEPVVPPELRVADIPAHRLARENFEEKRQNLAGTLTYERLVANLHVAGVRPRQIIHTFEGHSWEQVLAWSVRRHMSETGIIGYDNGNFSRMALCLYPARCEHGVRPLPDRIVTNGPLFRKILLADNFPPSLVTVGCGLRHTHLWDGPAARHRSNHDDTGAIRILVATAMGLGDTVELVSKALEAFAGDRNYEVIVKFHPALDEKLVIRHLGKVPKHDNVRFVPSPIQELLPCVDIMLYTYSVVCYEALHKGIPPIFVKSESFLNLDQLDANPKLRWEATTPEDLCRVAREIAAMSPEERHVWQRRAAEVVRAALAPITPESVHAFLI